MQNISEKSHFTNHIIDNNHSVYIDGIYIKQSVSHSLGCGATTSKLRCEYMIQMHVIVICVDVFLLCSVVRV